MTTYGCINLLFNFHNIQRTTLNFQKYFWFKILDDDITNDGTKERKQTTSDLEVKTKFSMLSGAHHRRGRSE